MPTLKALEKRLAERVAMARTLLEQRASLERMQLSEVEFVIFRLGCSIAEGEKLVKLAKQCDICEGKGKLRGKSHDFSTVTCAACSGSGLRPLPPANEFCAACAQHKPCSCDEAEEAR